MSFVYRSLIRRLTALVFIVTLKGTASAEPKGDALFIEKDGSVWIGGRDTGVRLSVDGTVSPKELNIMGTVSALKYKGDGAALRVDGAQGLKEILEGKLDKSGGRLLGDLWVTGRVRAGALSVDAPNPLRHRMYPDDPKVYQDIFEATKSGAIAKLGNPTYDNSSFDRNLWHGRRLIKYGNNSQQDGQGAQVAIPEGYDTVWVRLCGDRWNVVHAYFLDKNKEDLGLWVGGYRSANSYSPDGSLSDGSPDGNGFVRHQWVSIPVRRAGILALVSKAGTSDSFWLSGLAFSKNPWAHAVQSAYGFFIAANGGDKTDWGADWHNWNGDSLSAIKRQTNWELKVPVVASGRDKLLYLIEHNSNWNGGMHTGIAVNGVQIERFTSTYDSPFARHWNSKFYARYIAARIPRKLIGNTDRWLSVRIDMRQQLDNGIYFREIGTHDLDVPSD